MKKHHDGSWFGGTAPAVTPSMTVPWLLNRRATNTPDSVCIERRTGIGSSWVKITAAEFQADVIHTARGFLGLGLNPGDTVAIFGATSYEWSLLDVAAQYAGLIVVPIYESNSAEQVDWVLNDSSIRLVLTDSLAHAAVVESVRTSSMIDTIVYDDDGLARLRSAGDVIPTSDLLARTRSLKASDLATIIYTSGTTGNPKGVELTHGNIVAICLSTVQAEHEIIGKDDARVLLFLPLAHVMARIVFYFAIAGGGRVAHVGGVKNLMSDIASFQPTALLCVPRVLEKVYNASEAKVRGPKLKIFRWAAQVAVRNSEKRLHGPIFRVQRFFARKLVWKKITTALGGNCMYAISAGAPLGKRLGHFYRGIGFTVIEAFGLTETTGPSTANRPKSISMGSVGRPLPGTSIRIAEDGEVLLKGPHIFRGYHNNPEATAAVLDTDGWFHTGDIGTIDRRGFTTITGRKKELIVTAGGKNVAPAVLEDKLRGHPLVSQVVVVGDRRPFVGALITLDADMLPGWLRGHGLPRMDATEAAAHPAVLEALQRAVDRTNDQVSKAESIRKFTIITGDFTEDNGLLTPSLKVRREKVLSRYAHEIEDLYIDTRQK